VSDFSAFSVQSVQSGCSRHSVDAVASCAGAQSGWSRFEKKSKNIFIFLKPTWSAGVAVLTLRTAFSWNTCRTGRSWKNPVRIVSEEVLVQLRPPPRRSFFRGNQWNNSMERPKRNWNWTFLERTGCSDVVVVFRVVFRAVEAVGTRLSGCSGCSRRAGRAGRSSRSDLAVLSGRAGHSVDSVGSVLSGDARGSGRAGSAVLAVGSLEETCSKIQFQFHAMAANGRRDRFTWRADRTGSAVLAVLSVDCVLAV